jgi:hypothetical protein
MGVLRSPSFRIGQIGNTCGKWDNGFYTEGYIHNLPLQMLIDNGSTCSILNHRIYLKLLDTTKDKPILQPSSCMLFDVNGNPLQLHGCFRQTLTLGEGSYELDFLVCNIYQDAILGQDFLLEHIDKIDFLGSKFYQLSILTFNAG